MLSVWIVWISSTLLTRRSVEQAFSEELSILESVDRRRRKRDDYYNKRAFKSEGHWNIVLRHQQGKFTKWQEVVRRVDEAYRPLQETTDKSPRKHNDRWKRRSISAGHKRNDLLVKWDDRYSRSVHLHRTTLQAPCKLSRISGTSILIGAPGTDQCNWMHSNRTTHSNWRSV